MQFPKPLIRISKKGNGDLEFTLCEEIPFELPPDGVLWLLPRKLRVPVGYVSDGASVPRIFWPILSPKIDPVTIAPSIIHDYLYDYAWKYGLDRLDCDIWYYNALSANGYPFWKNVLTFIGIRLFGVFHWEAT